MPGALVKATPAKLNGSVPLTAPADIPFTVQAKEAGGDCGAIFQSVGTVTTLTASLQAAVDGVNFTDYIIAGSFISNTAPLIKVTLVPGVLYRVHATALTGSQDIWACTS